MKIQISKLKDKYIFELEELDIYHNDKDLVKGYQYVESKAEEVKKFLNENNIILKKNTNENKSENINVNYNIIIKKNLIRSFFNLTTILLSLSIIFFLVFSTIKKNEIKGGRHFWENFHHQLSKIANKKMDKEKEDAILKDIRKLIEKYKPFFNEFKKISD